MAERYSIDGQILTDIADGIRNKVGDTKTIYQEAIYEYSYNQYVFDASDILVVPGASKIVVSNISVVGDTYYTKIAGGSYSGYSKLPSEEYTIDTLPSEMTFTGVETVSFAWKCINQYASGADISMTATLTGYDENDEILVNKAVEIPRVMTPEQMTDEISDMAIIPSEALNLTGNCAYKFYWGGQDWLINLYGDRMTTNGLTDATSMFASSKLKSIPFELNFDPSEINSLSSLFNGCSSLTEIPKINNAKPYGPMNEMFYNCTNLRYLPEDIETWFNWSEIDTATTSYIAYRGRNTFNGCYSLRSVPMGFLNHNNPYGTSSSYSLFYGLFQNCYCLDEIIGLPLARVGEKAWTSNMFSNMVSNCYRLKNITFATNEDGSPIVANWKSQTIDLSSVGYAGSTWYITDYNSGITADKQVKDDATYQALKNDPDWYSGNVAYSRYNHASAVATINSLPDTTSSGGTNTIKFKGAAGSATDGGAINTLTEEEIAVATAKGWTVSLV